MPAQTRLLITCAAVRDFYDSSFCRVFWKAVYLDGFLRQPSDGRKAELMFRSRLLGKSTDADLWQISKRKKGEPTQAKLNELAERAREVLKRLQVKPAEVQPVWEVPELNLIASPDLVCSSVLAPKAIMNIHFCACSDRNPDNGWDDLRQVYTTQGMHSAYVWHLLSNEWLPFIFLVFFKNGGIRLFNVKLTVQEIIRYEMLLTQFRKDVANLDDDEVNASYGKCERCPMNGRCPKRILVPRVEELIV